jgi:hypothetical protein
MAILFNFNITAVLLKFELVNQPLSWGLSPVFRIRAVRDFGDVKSGDYGGLVASEDNLSHDGQAWVYDEAVVDDCAGVSGDAQVRNKARILNRAEVTGRAVISGNAWIFWDACVSGDARISGWAHVWVFLKLCVR